MNSKNSNFFLMRHGETETNRNHIWQGSIDENLNENGRVQARYAAKLVNEINPGIIVSSSMLRARETAKIASEYLNGVEIKIEPGIRERSCGAAEGLNTGEILDRFGVRMDITSEEVDRIPGAEPFEEFLGRVVSTIESIYDKYHNEKVLIVSHGGVIRAFYNHRIRTLPPGIVFKNCSIISMSRNGGSWEVVDKYNTEQI